MKESDVVLALLPQADGTIKNRPSIVLRELPPYNDVLICGISTQLHQQVKDFDEIIANADDDFVSSSLVSNSLIRLSFLVVLPRKKDCWCNWLNIFRTPQAFAQKVSAVSFRSSFVRECFASMPKSSSQARSCSSLQLLSEANHKIRQIE